MPTHPDLTPERLDRLRATVARKAWDLNQKLTEAMARQDVDLATMSLPGKSRPGETPLERLRRYFDAVVAAQKRSRTDDAGMCVDCNRPIPFALLEEVPWTLRCPGCEAARE